MDRPTAVASDTPRIQSVINLTAGPVASARRENARQPNLRAMPVDRRSGQPLAANIVLAIPRGMKKAEAALDYIQDLAEVCPGLSWRHIRQHNRTLYLNARVRLLNTVMKDNPDLLRSEKTAAVHRPIRSDLLEAARLRPRTSPAGSALSWQRDYEAGNSDAYVLVRPDSRQVPEDEKTGQNKPRRRISGQDVLPSRDVLKDTLATLHDNARQAPVDLHRFFEDRPAGRLAFSRWVLSLGLPPALPIAPDGRLTRSSLELLVERDKALNHPDTMLPMARPSAPEGVGLR